MRCERRTEASGRDTKWSARTVPLEVLNDGIVEKTDGSCRGFNNVL